MKKILIISNERPDEKSGLARVVMTHAQSLIDKGFDVKVLARGYENRKLLIENVNVILYKYNSQKSSFNNFFQLRKQLIKCWNENIKEWNPDVIHGHDYIAYYFLRGTIKSHARKVFTIHDPLVYHQEMLGNLDKISIKHKVFKHIENKVYNYSDSIHCISKYTLGRISNIDIKKVKIIHHWVDMQKFSISSKRDDVRKSFYINKKDFVIFTIRNIEERMGIGNLIKAFEIIQMEIPNSKLIIGGKGPLLNNFKKYVEQKKIENVEFLGFISDEDLVLRYQSADVCIIPSLDGEGFGLPILESLSTGTQVLGTPVCAIPEVLNYNKDFLFNGTEPEDIYEGIVNYYKKECKTSRYVNREYVNENFSEELIINKIIKDYYAKSDDI